MKVMTTIKTHLPVLLDLRMIVLCTQPSSSPCQTP